MLCALLILINYNSLLMHVALFTEVKYNSNNACIYSPWLKSAIYWLINHCMDCPRTELTSYGRQFYFHDVICHIQPCNIDHRRHSVVYTTNGRSTFVKIRISVQTRVTRNSYALFEMAESV